MIREHISPQLMESSFQWKLHKLEKLGALSQPEKEEPSPKYSTLSKKMTKGRHNSGDIMNNLESIVSQSVL